jgi:2-polyprenyl-3-methyl-5-hydroxy-6-metoxy-1,4-benzoquinol methylase
MQGYSVKGIDVLDDLLRVGRKRKEVLEQRLGRALQCEFERRSVLALGREEYDVIWMEQAFHHLEPRAEVLLKLTSALRTGGALVMSETNGWNPAIQAWLFRARGFRTVIEMNGAPWGNERILTAATLSRLLGAHRVARRSVRHFRIFPNKPWADAIFARFGAFDELDRLLLRPLYTHYNYVGIKT